MIEHETFQVDVVDEFDRIRVKHGYIQSVIHRLSFFFIFIYARVFSDYQQKTPKISCLIESNMK